MPRSDSSIHDWHRLPRKDVLAKLQVNQRSGLSNSEIAKRSQQFGENSLPIKEDSHVLFFFLRQFQDFMIVVLLLAALVAGLVGDPQDAIVILVIVLINAVIGTVQQYRAEKALAALRKISAPEAMVLRCGQNRRIPASDLLPGDIVQLDDGSTVAADIRLLELSQLQIDESSLTGESVPVEKQVSALHEADLSLGDRSNMAYKGTIVNRGHGLGVVVATGSDTELGKIAGMLVQSERVKTPLQRRLSEFSRRLALAIIVICAVIFLFGFLRGEPALLMLLTAVSLAVAGIPEAMPAVVSVALALGARKLSGLRALMRNLPAVETLGSIDTICTDKTGTLTQNHMHLARWLSATNTSAISCEQLADLSDGQYRDLSVQCLALSNEVLEADDGSLLGDPTEVALVEAALKMGANTLSLQKQIPRIADLPFTSERGRMSTLHKDQSGVLLFCKGAPEELLDRCSTSLNSEGRQAIDQQEWLAQAEKLASEGFRVLALAYRRLGQVPPGMIAEDLETDLELLALVGLIDPPRDEAKAAVSACRRAGIRPIMITGDHPATAQTIACELGIADDDDQVLSGSQLADYSDSKLADCVLNTTVYARVSAAQKYRIVEALQAHGKVVAMTGDGVNDAPALRRADIGIAMGIQGTDVSREAADMVLLDDNFATIVAAVSEGRRIFDNIRKFVKYTMTSNAGEIWTLFLAPFLGLPLPLLPIHILWINLVTDGLPGLSLTVQAAEPGLDSRPPRPMSESMFANAMWQHILFMGLFIAALALFTQWLAIGQSWHWQTMVFSVLTFSQLAHVLVIQHDRVSLFNAQARANQQLFLVVLVTIALQLIIIYLPLCNVWFHTQPLSAVELSYCLLLPALVVLAVELEKYLLRTLSRSPSVAEQTA